MINFVKINKLMRQIAVTFTELQTDSRYALAARGLTGNKSYVASEALYHLLGGRYSKLVPMCLVLPNKKEHWWILDRNGHVYDIYESEYEEPIPYHKGEKGNFKTWAPSSKARTLMNKILECT